jgi:putative ABC transport system substrate-binding protein
MMDRRAFIGSIAGGLLAVPVIVRAQKSAVPVIGLMLAGSPAQWDVSLFRQGLSEAGYIEGKNVAIEFRWAEGRDERLPAIAAELVSRHVAVLVASGNSKTVLAARAATSTIPIVFMTGTDPVEIGLVASLGRPGGNVTGISFITSQLDAKRLELLHELVPKASVIALLMNSDDLTAESNGRALQDAARSLGQQARILNARTVQEIDAAFAALVQLRAGALLVASSSFFFLRREQLVALAARHAVPASFDVREFVTAGGLMSYGPSLSEVRRQAGIYTGKILNGAKPADLPLLQPTKFELAINLKTAKALGLTIPPSVLARADEVIQ